MLNKLKNFKEKNGFTLVELIVVIAIIAVLTAVLVPLIGNYGNQATYTMLQDGAQTISNNINNACQAVSLGGTPMADTWVRGEKTGGTLTVTTSGNNEKLKASVKSILETTMPNGSCFYAVLTNGAVESVIYSNTTHDAATYSKKKVDKVETFNEAYEISGLGAVGLSGMYKKDGADIAEIT